MHRNITYRLIPVTRFRAAQISRTAGACRWVWNWALKLNNHRYRRYLDQQRLMLRGAQPAGCGTGRMQEEVGENTKSLSPPTTFFSLGKEFTRVRRMVPWLKALPYAPVRHVLKYQGDVWKRYFDDPRAGRPQRKARRGDDSFTIPQDVKIRTDSITGVTRLWVPKAGWCILERRGGNPYAGCPPVQAVVKRVLNGWRCIVCYDVGEIDIPDNGPVLGIDRNCGQVAVADGHGTAPGSAVWELAQQAEFAGIKVKLDRQGLILHAPESKRLEAKKRHYQRVLARRVKGSNRRAVARHRCAKVSRKLAMARDNWHHQVSRVIADSYGTAVVEKLNTKGMTASAKGTAMNHGKNVKPKAGLNRSILATGWHGFRDKLDYKAADVIEVKAAYTSQACSSCGHVAEESRRSQSRFRCVACGYEGNADINAALNVLALGTGDQARPGEERDSVIARLPKGRGARASPAPGEPSTSMPCRAAA